VQPLRGRERILRLAAALPPIALLAALGCGARSEQGAPAAAAPDTAASDRGEALILYSSRGEEHLAPLLERFEEETGIEVEVRYGETSELTGALFAEGVQTAADLFLSQDAEALGALSRKGLLRELSMDLVRRVPAAWTGSPQRHDWVGISGRARAIVYDPGATRPEQLPQTLEAVADARYRGRFGIAPASASFRTHMAVYRVVAGEDALERLLARINDNQPRLYAGNDAIVQGVADGEVEWGLVSHDSLWRAAGAGPPERAAHFFMPRGDASGFVDAAGIGVLSDDPRASELVRFLLGEEAQTWLAEQTREYALALGGSPAPELPPLSALRTPQVDFADVAAVLDETGKAIRRAGLVS
jgi:iron(III) transport system substrate-binding protein